jgi:hypothetical protein
MSLSITNRRINHSSRAGQFGEGWFEEVVGAHEDWVRSEHFRGCEDLVLLA